VKQEIDLYEMYSSEQLVHMIDNVAIQVRLCGGGIELGYDTRTSRRLVKPCEVLRQEKKN
jgi:hypothetical protein